MGADYELKSTMTKSTPPSGVGARPPSHMSRPPTRPYTRGKPMPPPYHPPHKP